MRNVLDKMFEKVKTHFMSINTPENRTVHEIMWKNFVQPDRSQMRMWCMRIA